MTRVESRSWILVRRGSLLPLALLGVGAAVLSLLAGPLDPTRAAASDFPSLVMVWRDAANYRINGTPGSQTFRLDYTDRCHQRVTLLEHSALPDVAGSFTQFDGRTEITHDPRHRPDDVRSIGPADCWPPDRYLLVPIAMGGVREIAARPGWTQKPTGDGLAVLTYDGTLPIADGVAHEQIEITYRPVDGLPTRVVYVVNGREAQRREVLELHVGKL